MRLPLAATLATVLAASATSANAQNFGTLGPGVPVLTDWTGLYVGAHAGIVGTSLSGINSLAAVQAAQATSGLQCGALFGANLQLGPVVVGAEADVTLLHFQTQTMPLVGVVSVDLDWMASLRARAGLPVANLLFYGTAGVTMTNVGATLGPFGTDQNVLRGWTAGAGVEAAVFGGWRLRAEYLYAQTDQGRFQVPTQPAFHAHAGTHTLRAAVVVRFGN